MKIFTGKKMVALIALFLFAFHVNAQKSYSGTSGGAWSTSGNWSPSGVPNAGQSVTIPNGKNVNITADAVCSSLTILTGSTANTITISAGKTLTVGGAVTIQASTGAVTKTIAVATGNLICQSISLEASTANNRKNSITLSTGTIQVSGDVELAGTTARSILNITGTGTLQIGGDIVGVGNFTPGNNTTIELNGSVPQTVPFSGSNFDGIYGPLIINNSSGTPVNVNTNVTLKGDLTLQQNTLHIGAGVELTLSKNADRTSGNLTSESTGKVIYGKTSNNQIVVDGDYGILEFSNFKKILPNGVVNISGVFTPGTFSSHTITGSTVNFTGATAQDVPADFVFTNLGLSGAGTKNVTASAASSLSVGQNFSVSSAVSYTNVSNISIGSDFNGSSSINSGAIPISVGGTWLNTATGYTITGAVTYTGATETSIRIGGINYKDLNFTASRGGSFPITSDIPNPATISGTLTVGDNATFVTNNKVTFLSTASTISNIAPLTGSAVINGNAGVQLYFTGGAATRGTRMVAPVIDDSGLADGSKFFQQLQDNMVITGAGGVANGFDSGSALQPYATTLTKYNESATMAQPQFLAVQHLDASVPLAPPGEGFFLFYRGDRTGYNPPSDVTKLGSAYVPESFSALFNGPIVQGNISVPITNSDNVGDGNNGYNVVGNPYVATIDWESVYTANSSTVADEFRIIRPGGSVMSRKVVGGVPVVVNAGDGLAAQYLQPGQAFYIRKLDPGSGTLDFSESNKSVASTPDRLLISPGQKNEKLAMSTNGAAMSGNAQLATVFYFNLEDQVNSDETAIIFGDEFNPNFDANDVPYFSGSTVILSSQTDDGQAVAINFTKAIGESYEVKLNVNAAATGPVSLNFTSIAALGSYGAILKDNYLDTIIDIKANPVYQFTIDKSIQQSYGLTRFVLLFSAPQPIVVSFSSFTVALNGKNVQLNWITPSEQQSTKFEIEHSSNGQTFTVIGEKLAAGTSSVPNAYSFADQSPENGINYYRLKGSFSDGTFAYSEVKSIEFTPLKYQHPKFHFEVFPNPTTQFISIIVENIRARLVVYDLFGRVKKSANYERNQAIKMDVSDLRSGIYFAEITDRDNKNTTDIVIFIKK